MTAFLFAQAVTGAGGLIGTLVYFLVAILICGLVYYCTKRFFPEAAMVVLIILCIVLLLVSLKLFGFM